MAATNTNIKINIVEPGSSTPVDPATGTTEISAPDTGLFTHSIGGPEATAIGVVLILTIVAIIVTILYRKQKKAGKVTKLVRTIEQTKTIIKSKKRITAGLTALALLASIGTLTTLLANAGKSNTNAAEGDGLTLDVDSEELTIEVGDEPVFAYLPVELTVEEATQAGYTITAYTNSTDIVSTTDSSNKIPMVAINEEDLSQYTSLTDNTWGLSLEKPQDQNSEVYTTLSTDQDVPTILKSIDDYSETEENDTTTIYYGFYITPDTPKGTYEGSVTNYEATPNYITTLSFNGNGNDGGEDMDSIIIPAGTTITLPQNTYTKDGYTFVGWNTVADGTGEAYADEVEFTAPLDKTQNITLYAQWKEILYMQDVATWGNTLNVGDEAIAVDNRDDKEYYVARLADGNIWMTQNLDHNIVDTPNFYTYANTDIGHGATPDTAATWTGTATYPTGTTTWNSSYTAPESYDPGDLYWNGTIIYSQTECEEFGGTLKPWGDCVGANITSSAGNAHYYIGNYYNWTAAVAMNSSSSYTTDYTDVNQSICPAGWRLPTYSGDKSYQNLVNAQNLTADTSGNIQNAPAYFVYGGYWRNGSFYFVGGSGYYWSSVVDSSYYSYILDFNVNGILNPRTIGSRDYGYSLRCVAR